MRSVAAATGTKTVCARGTVSAEAAVAVTAATLPSVSRAAATADVEGGRHADLARRSFISRTLRARGYGAATAPPWPVTRAEVHGRHRVIAIARRSESDTYARSAATALLL